MDVTVDRSERADERSIGLAKNIATGVRVIELSPLKAQLDFSPLFDGYIALSLRRNEARRQISSSLRGVVRRQWIAEGSRLVIEAIGGELNTEDAVKRCAQALVLPASRPLTPRLVLAALPITPQERLRWTKDGRMPPAGSVMMRRGRPISVATYGVDMIAALTSEPSIIERWREADAAR